MNIKSKCFLFVHGPNCIAPKADRDLNRHAHPMQISVCKYVLHFATDVVYDDSVLNLRKRRRNLTL